MTRDAGSFRDPNGYIFYCGGRVLRAVTERGRADYEAVRNNPTVRELLDTGDIVGSAELDTDEAALLAPEAAFVIEHDRIPFLSYPYEWPFALLKKAARFHLNLQIKLLDAGITLSDATAYNVQFLGVRPVLIDLLSLRPYHEGELWMGHHQFMQQFLHPLLLDALGGIPFNSWYRGNLDGIYRRDLLRCIPFRKRLSRRVFKQITLPQMIEQEQELNAKEQTGKVAPAKLEKSSLRGLLADLERWVSELAPATVSGTIWADYQKTRTYDRTEVNEKRRSIEDFVRTHRPKKILDIGCNAGEFSEVALRAGCESAIGFDLDAGALHLACDRADRNGLNLLPLRMDLLNPSPGSGWNFAERKSLSERMAAAGSPDAILALAVIHHLSIAGNVPLDQAVHWLVTLAPKGVIEFVHKSDETVQKMLRFREDIFEDYSEEKFVASLESCSRILERREISVSGRSVFFYSREA